MNKERLLKLADFLENNVPEKNFDMSSWGTDLNLNECGSTGCAFGWATEVSEFKEAGLHLIKTEAGNIYPSFRDVKAFDAAVLFFNISMSQASFLFDPEWLDEYETDDEGQPMYYCREEETPKQVASRIREFVETHS